MIAAFPVIQFGATAASVTNQFALPVRAPTSSMAALASSAKMPGPIAPHAPLQAAQPAPLPISSTQHTASSARTSGLAALNVQFQDVKHVTRPTNSKFPPAFNAGRSGATATTVPLQNAQCVQLHSGGMELTVSFVVIRGLDAFNVTHLDVLLAIHLAII